MTSPSSFNVSGLLGANSIDTTALISQLMQAQALPQTRLKNELNVQQTTVSAYQAVNSTVSAVRTAAQALTDATAWAATAATSSNSAVVATSTGTAGLGSTTFDVLKIAAAQVTTVAADAAGNFVPDLAAGIVVGGPTDVIHPASGSATDVAAAINAASVGVRASVVNADGGVTMLQLTATATGTAHAFQATGFSNAAQTVVAADDAQIGVGTVGAGGYTVTSPTNTFTGVVPGVTFSVNAKATGVTVSVTNDEQSLSDKVNALVNAANGTTNTIGAATAKGAILQGELIMQNLRQAIGSAVSNGTSTGDSLKPYGIDMDSTGVMSFDAKAFAAAYAADPAGTKAAVSGSFATSLAATASAATDPTTGSITQAIKSATDQSTLLNKQIDAWTSRLADIQTRLQTKYANMQTMLAKLQSQSTYLTNMLKSMSGSSSSSGQ